LPFIDLVVLRRFCLCCYRSQVTADLGTRKAGQAAAARIFAIIDAPLDEADPFSDKGEKPSTVDGTIYFKSVQFSYPTRPNNPIYYGEGVSLDIASKESVAFVGRSGSGKSTAEQLVLRFYNSTGGTVSLDGHNVEDLNITWLRQQIGYVGQQPVLFSGTVRSNILLGKPDATEEEIIASAKAANAHDFVMKLAQGYDTDIGTAGSLLSGGQKQRLVHWITEFKSVIITVAHSRLTGVLRSFAYYQTGSLLHVPL